MNKQTSNEIVKILRTIIINPKPELDFKNNYELTIAVILSAQTTDKKVNAVTKELFLKYPSFKELKDGNLEEIEEIVMPLGLYKMKAKNIISCASVIDNDYDGIVPNDFDKLVKISGIGRKCANVILALGYNIPALPVDTHLYRMAKRLGYIKPSENVNKAEEAYKKYIPKEEWIDAHHLFLLFGRYHCLAQRPKCVECKLIKYCKEKNKNI